MDDFTQESAELLKSVYLTIEQLRSRFNEHVLNVAKRYNAVISKMSHSDIPEITNNDKHIYWIPTENSIAVSWIYLTNSSMMYMMNIPIEFFYNNGKLEEYEVTFGA